MDWQLTCRVCLETGDMVSLFDWDENNEQLANKFNYCCGILIDKNDSLPTLICLNCVDRLTYSYQFKQQCLSSNETLKECLEEFERTSAAVTEANSSQPKESETITIKQENGILLQYDLPVEHEAKWTRTLTTKTPKTVITSAPQPRKRGRPRKYPNDQGQIESSPYNRKKPLVVQREPESLTSLLESGSLDLKEEPLDAKEELDDNGDFDADGDDDPDFMPEEDANDEDLPFEHEVPLEMAKELPKKRGRPRKATTDSPKKPKKELEGDGEDVLLKETILAFSEPIPEHILNPKPKTKKKYDKKKYTYEKTHTCETCGTSFASNAALQAHIRRHLGIKPFVCSLCGYACVLNVELRRHMLRHTGQKPYKCRICDRRFGDYGSRQKHESICGFKSAFSGGLKRHMLRHAGHRPYKCRTCERRFYEHGDRQKHERLHMGVRPYQCSLCGKAFTYSYVLANHMLTHTGEKKYACAPCNKKFTKAHHLKYHNKVHHKELYIQQQLEAEAKKRRQIQITGIPGLNASGEYNLDIQPALADGEADENMQVVEGNDNDESEKETDRAVASMQAVSGLDTEFIIGGGRSD